MNGEWLIDFDFPIQENQEFFIHEKEQRNFELVVRPGSWQLRIAKSWYYESKMAIPHAETRLPTPAWSTTFSESTLTPSSRSASSATAESWSEYNLNPNPDLRSKMGVKLRHEGDSSALIVCLHILFAIGSSIKAQKFFSLCTNAAGLIFTRENLIRTLHWSEWTP